MYKKFMFYLFVTLSLIISTNFTFSQWVPVEGIYTGGEYPLIVTQSGLICTGFVAGICVSTNSGQNWITYRLDRDVVALESIGSYLFAGTDSGVYRSTNNGQNWIRMPLNVTDYVWGLAKYGNTIWAGTSNQGLWYSTDYGNSWVQTAFPVTLYITSLGVNGSNIFVGTLNQGLLRSTDNGNSWSTVNWGNGYTVNGIMYDGNTIYVCPAGQGVYYSTNNGNTWTSMGLSNLVVFYLLHVGNNFLASTQANGLYLSTNNGSSWTQKQFIGYTVGQIAYTGSKYVLSIPKLGGGLFDSCGVWTSTNLSNWSRTGLNSYVNSFLKTGSYIFAASQRVFRSSDNGITWLPPQPSNLPTPQCLGYVSSTLLFGSYGFGIFRSSDNGITWAQVPQLPTSYVYAFTTISNTIFAGISTGTTGGYGVWKSTNSGLNWTQIGLNNTYVYTLANSGTNLFAGTPYTGVYKSTDQGLTWTQTSLNNKTVNVLYFNGTNLWAGTVLYGVYLSTDFGVTWVQTTLNNKTIKSIVAQGNTVIAGTQNTGIYVSTNLGNTWVQRNENLLWSDKPIYALEITNNGYVLAGGGDVRKRPLSEITSIEENSSNVLTSFRLGQNYPNPFNPTTKIEFSIARRSYVNISLYNILGEKIKVLTDHIYNPGTFEINFDGSDLPSGIYYYKLTTENFQEIKKMVLLK